jgi:hypothetical protein
MGCRTRMVHVDTLQRVTCATKRRCVGSHVPKEFVESIENATDLIKSATARITTLADMKKATEETVARIKGNTRGASDYTSDYIIPFLACVAFIILTTGVIGTLIAFFK